jgi:hypothetical protein
MRPHRLAYELAMSQGVPHEEYERRMGRCVEEGYVFSTPELFMAAHDDEHEGQPAYFVLFAVGINNEPVLKRFLKYAPHPKPWVVWARNNEQRRRAFAWDRLAKKAGI